MKPPVVEDFEGLSFLGAMDNGFGGADLLYVDEEGIVLYLGWVRENDLWVHGWITEDEIRARSLPH